MKSVVCQDAELRVRDRPEPTPGKGQVLLEVLRCGICGSDLHMRQHCDRLSELAVRTGFPPLGSSRDEIVFGHEFCGAVLDYGPRASGKLKAGTHVCALPVLRVGEDVAPLGLCARAPGAYAERVVVEASMMMPVPNGLAPDRAAFTEPMAVALHAVRRGDVKARDVVIVIGCGPVGLSVICMLKARGVKTIVASDFSARRRELAQRCGADVVIDPAQGSPFASWREYGLLGDAAKAVRKGVALLEKARRMPIPLWDMWRLADRLGVQPKRPVIFECVGVPGVLQQIIEAAPLYSRVVVAGVCMVPDTIEPALAINKEVDLRFVLGYTPLEFHDTLTMLAEGKVDTTPLLTGRVGLDGVANAFAALSEPEEHAKILVDPRLSGAQVQRA